MAAFVALYRGINVGGKNPVKMESLRALHEELGHRNVASYIQSGNVVFSASGSAATIGRKLADEFAKSFGFPAKVKLVNAQRFSALVTDTPYAQYAGDNPKTVHVAICDGEPSVSGLKALHAKTGGREQYVIRQELIYLYAPDGFGTSKFAAGLEKAAGVSMTARNWRTIEALWEMVNALR
jgi:uncharacterized protein (DUF1697 family)